MRIQAMTLLPLFLLLALCAALPGASPPVSGAPKQPAQEAYDLVVSTCRDGRQALTLYRRGERLELGSFPGDFYREAGQPEDADSPVTGTWEKSNASKKSMKSIIRTCKLCFYRDNCFIFVEIESILLHEEGSPPFYRDAKVQERQGTWKKTGKNRAHMVFSLQ